MCFRIGVSFAVHGRWTLETYQQVNRVYKDKYEDHFKSSWTGGSAPLLCKKMRWLLFQVVVGGVT
jgi:hypothetical protein